MLLKEILFPVMSEFLLLEVRDQNVVTLSASINGREKNILKIWLDSTKKNLMVALIDAFDLKDEKKELFNFMASLALGRFFNQSFIKKYLDRSEIRVLDIINVSKGNSELYGLPFAYFKIKLSNSENLDKQKLLEMMKEFKNYWNTANTKMKIININ
jgi:hypothetical protein